MARCRESRGVEAVVQVGGCVHDPPPVVVRSRELDRVRLDIPVSRCERLPLERQQPMSLEVAERAVVRKDIEAIGRSLERPSRLVPAVPPGAHVGSQDFAPLIRRHPADNGDELIVGQVGSRVQSRRHDFDFAVRVEVAENDFGPGFRGDAPKTLVRRFGGRCFRFLEIPAPAHPALGLIHAREKRRDDFSELGQHQLRVRPSLGEWMRSHAQQERFVRLAGAEDADIGLDRRGQQAPQRVNALARMAAR